MTMESKAFYLPELTGLRFVAFFLVFIHHHPLLKHEKIVGHYFSQLGWVGVDIFFALSGFLLFTILCREKEQFEKISYKNFYIRRILRIWPLYFFYAIMAILLIGVSNEPGSELKIGKVGGLLFFYDNFNNAFSPYFYTDHPFLKHLWTISLEEQFYLFMPFVVMALSGVHQEKLGTRLLYAFLGFFILGALFSFKYYPKVHGMLIIDRYQALFAGILIALHVQGKLKWHFLEKYKSLILILSTTLFVWVYTRHNMFFDQGLTIGLFTGAVLLFSLKSEPMRQILRQQWIHYLGKISFGLYIYHILAIKISEGILENFQPNHFIFWSFISSLILTITMASLSYYLLEKPFLKLKGKFV